MNRKIYRAYCFDKMVMTRQMASQSVDKDVVASFSLFMFENILYLYMEYITNVIIPEKIFDNCDLFLKQWPCDDYSRFWMPMTEIFHHNQPVSTEQWKRKTEVEKRTGRIARLKPEMIQSYVFYHFLHQEECPGKGSKYGMISLFESDLFFYDEEPYVVEECLVPGKLKTKMCPQNWGEVMEPHFNKWDDLPEDKNIWRNIEFIMGM